MVLMLRGLSELAQFDVRFKTYLTDIKIGIWLKSAPDIVACNGNWPGHQGMHPAHLFKQG